VPYYSFKPSRDNCAYHEVITSSTVRFFADVDHSSLELFEQFLTVIRDVFEQGFNVPVKVRYLHNPASQGYHVYTNAACSLSLCRFIADRINAAMNKADYVDVAPYGMYKSLRLFNCPKVTLQGEVKANSRYTLPDRAEPHLFMVTNTIDCIFIQAPLHISQELPLDQIYQHGIQEADGADLQALRKYVDEELKCPDAVLRSEGGTVYINFGIRRPICPYHNRVHDNENMLVRKSNSKEGQGLLLFCFREAQGEVRHAQRIVIGVEREEVTRIAHIADRLDTLVDAPLDCAITCHQRYVDLLPMVQDQRTIFLKSHLGTGKTEAVKKMIVDKSYQKVLYLSFRKTFTQALATRFADLGAVLQYSEQRGDLYHTTTDKHFRIAIVQVEALSRYKDQCDLLVVDEWESVQSQMKSQYALGTVNVLDNLRRIFQNAQQCVIMDGFLQQTSIDLFNRLVGNEEYVVQQNTAQTFADHTANVTYSSRHNENLRAIFDNVKNTFAAGGKSCCFITSNSQSEQLELLLQQQVPGIKTKRYHGDQTHLDSNGLFHIDNKRADMTNLDTIAAETDVLIYTSTITAGISIDLTTFQYVAASLSEHTCDPLQFV